MIRHGDILLRQLSEFPPNAELEEPMDRVVLATGTVTGHAHVLSGLVRMGYYRKPTEQRKRRLLQLLQPCALTHEQHKTLTVPEGWYELIRQRVYEPGGWTLVSD
jgi:hypothetical protein